jgi:hypothetical protein
MTRRVTAGSAGGAGVAGLQAFTTILTSAPNLDITVDPTGTGRFLVAGPAQIQNQNTLRFADADSSNWVAFQSAATVASNVTWTLPAIDGTNDQVLTTNGSGTLSWTGKSIGVENNTTDSVQNFILFSSVSSGNLVTSRVSTSALTFQPSTATFTCTNLSAGSITETSSITLKENIEPIENALDSILKLSGVTYNRRDTQVYEAGLIAEWVEKILPDLVTYDISGNVVGVKYTKLTAYLIEAVKTLKTEIDDLKSKK